VRELFDFELENFDCKAEAGVSWGGSLECKFIIFWPLAFDVSCTEFILKKSYYFIFVYQNCFLIADSSILHHRACKGPSKCSCLCLPLYDDLLHNFVTRDSQLMNGAIPWNGSREKDLLLLQLLIDACTEVGDIVVDCTMATGD
jgi:hypothetical protein